ncbi:nucleoside deaminase [Thermaurantiacus sp.]
MGFPASPHMARALALARSAAAAGEVPVGAVVTAADGTLLAEAHNRTIADRDPTAHAEMLAIRAAARRLGSERLSGCTLWVTLEPCAMCAGAIAQARLARLVYGAEDPKGGGVAHGARVFAQATCHHRPEIVAGVGDREAGRLLAEFFAARRGR